MITKTLRTSGGDYSTLDDLIQLYLRPQLVAGLSDDITVNVQGGQTFGTLTYLMNFSMAAALWAGKTITFQTNPAEQATPAVLLGDVSTNGGGSSTLGFLTFQSLKLGASTDNGNSCMFFVS